MDREVGLRWRTRREKSRGDVARLLGVFFTLVMLAAGCSVRPDPPITYPEGSGTLVIEAVGFRTDHGRAIASLFSGAEGFPAATGKGILSREAPIAGGHSRFVFTGVPWGEYAVSVLHDEDGDGRMRSNWMGMAREGHGVSNSPESRFGPPDFDQARFVFIAQERLLPIRIRYDEKRGPAFGRQ